MPDKRAPLTRAELNRMTCAAPGCTHTNHAGLFLHSRCHVLAPLWAEYRPDTGTLRITCAECDALVTTIVVKETP
jgi:hypothetical protein